VTAEPPLALAPLDGEHSVAAFDCGVAALNDYLIRRALSDQQAGKSRTLVAARGKHAVAFVSLAAASVEPSSATERVAAGQGAQSVPVILLACLAVDAPEQRCGLGAAMLVEALARCARAAELVGVRAILMHAKGEQARSFSQKYGFAASPTNPLHLFMLMKDVRKSLALDS
jgi:GNAT superfamily N-acetyltransferase